MRITKWGEYGILFSLYLAKAGSQQAVGAAELAEFHSIPLQYAQQILQRLRRGGIVKSIRGPGGGYQLEAPPAEVNLKMILCAAEGDTFEVICATHPLLVDVCAVPNCCAVHQLWSDLKASIESLLEQHTLADMLLNHRSNIPCPSNGNGVAAH